jgi:hypothetical protein
MLRTCLIASIACAASGAAFAGNLADVIVIGSGAGVAGATVDVPIYIRDTAGTPLGLDQPPGSHVQSYMIDVDYDTNTVQSVSFSRAGITTALTPSSETAFMPVAGVFAVSTTFSEVTDPIPFTLNAALPGNLVGVLHFVLAANAPVGTTPITQDFLLTFLRDDKGSAATQETTSTSTLTVIDGSLTVNPSTPVRLQSFEVE